MGYKASKGFKDNRVADFLIVYLFDVQRPIEIISKQKTSPLKIKLTWSCDYQKRKRGFNGSILELYRLSDGLAREVLSGV